MSAETYVSRTTDGQKVPTSWGELNWKITNDTMSGTEMTLGTCRIEPGQRNPLHSHPNCEEFLYVMSGSCEHKLGEEVVTLNAGDVIRIPRDVPHWARCTSSEPMIALIVFSSGERRAVDHEEGGGVA
ncbi:cupin [Devosia geojensis]|uniref:Cupin n=1 Tax=Devosia geojensis TaxID=443610 RepID=A0A0F5FQX2_9HYPH|nr:cupin domain-containing protein [Devosia geojensis]KKB11284.1 cupin [Devosia geojensis]